MRRFELMLAAVLLVPATSLAEDLTIASWGGAYEAAQRTAIIEPFARETDHSVRVEAYFGEAEALEIRAIEEGWDAVDMIEGQAIAACADGKLQPLDFAEMDLDPADFAPFSPDECGVPHTVFAHVIAYDDRQFPGAKPTRLEDFFDLEKYPGKRAVEKNPNVILEWALLAQGVPTSQLYDLLSTERGLDLAFRKLDEIRGEIIWWTDPNEAPQLLATGQAAMASGYNGRFFAEQREDDASPIVVIWDGRLIGKDFWVIPKTARNPDAAAKFISYAVSAESMAALAELIPYGPSRMDAFDLIGLHPDDGTQMRAYLPNAPEHGARSLTMDPEWYAYTDTLRQRRFQEWLAEGN